jgi:hypothetical protein
MFHMDENILILSRAGLNFLDYHILLIASPDRVDAWCRTIAKSLDVAFSFAHTAAACDIAVKRSFDFCAHEVICFVAAVRLQRQWVEESRTCSSIVRLNSGSCVCFWNIVYQQHSLLITAVSCALPPTVRNGTQHSV